MPKISAELQRGQSALNRGGVDDVTLCAEIQTDCPNGGVPANGEISPVVTSIFAHIQRLNLRSDVDMV